MLRSIFIVLLLVSISGKISAQKTLVINSMHVYPPFPTINDSVYIILDVMTPLKGVSHSYMVTDEHNKATIESCYVYDNTTDTTHYTDTVNLGIRQKGNLIVYFKAKASDNDENCYSNDSVSNDIEFEVADFIDFEVETAKAVKCYPYPYADEFIFIESPFPMTKIEVMSGSGKFLINKKIDSKKKYQLDLGELTNGGYYLMIYDKKNQQHRVRIYVR